MRTQEHIEKLEKCIKAINCDAETRELIYKIDVIMEPQSVWWIGNDFDEEYSSPHRSIVWGGYLPGQKNPSYTTIFNYYPNK